MSIHIWCPRASDAAVLLRTQVCQQQVRCYKTPPQVTNSPKSLLRFLSRIQPGDLWVNWGPPPGPNMYDAVNAAVGNKRITILNSAPSTNKRDQLLLLARSNVPCPKVFTGPGEGRVGRSLHHQAGLDILQGYGRDYWTEKLELVQEFRIHVFDGMSIRAGLKVRRPSATNPHPWVRSYEGGWGLTYGPRCQLLLKRPVRDVAKQAITVLGLEFGAVDVGVTAAGRPFVLEVNLAPGLDAGGSVDVYVQKLIQRHNTQIN